MIVLAPSKPAKASHTAIVPLANGSISNTPIGPFHTTVLAPAKAALMFSTDLGPMSNPMYPSGTSSPQTLISPSAANAVLITESTGKINLSPALAKISLATSILSSSTKELPIE